MREANMRALSAGHIVLALDWKHETESKMKPMM
jgi:hypothetical protein